MQNRTQWGAREPFWLKGTQPSQKTSHGVPQVPQSKRIHLPTKPPWSLRGPLGCSKTPKERKRATFRKSTWHIRRFFTYLGEKLEIPKNTMETCELCRFRSSRRFVCFQRIVHDLWSTFRGEFIFSSAAHFRLIFCSFSASFMAMKSRICVNIPAKACSQTWSGSWSTSKWPSMLDVMLVYPLEKRNRKNIF